MILFNIDRINYLLNNHNIPPELITEKKEELSLRRIIQLYLTNQNINDEDIKYVLSFIKNNENFNIILYLSNLEKNILTEISEFSLSYVKQKSN